MLFSVRFLLIAVFFIFNDHFSDPHKAVGQLLVLTFSLRINVSMYLFMGKHANIYFSLIV